MAISVSNISSFGTGVDATSFATSITTLPATLEVAWIEAARDGSTNPATPVVTHGGITATQVASLLWITTGVTRRQMWAYTWDSGPGATGNIVADFGVLHSGCSIHVDEITGSDVANGAVQSIVQAVATGADLSGTSGSITLGGAGNGANRPIECFVHQFNEESNVEAGWTILTNITHNNPASGMKVGWNSTTFDTSVVVTWTTSSPYGGIAIEIKDASAGGGGAASLDPFGMSGFFGG